MKISKKHERSENKVTEIMNKPIGVFDSGVGGLSVLSELQKLMPNEKYIYFGDSANVPYGEKTEEQLIGYSKNILDWYESLGVKMVIMACNTSSAVTLPYFKDSYSFPVLGLIEPVSKFIGSGDTSKLGLIATAATVKSNAYAQAITKYANKELHQVACPGLVQLVEQNKLHTLEARTLTAEYIQPLMDSGAEKIILGCTHYPFLSSIINEIVGRDILLNPAEYLAQEAYSIIGGQETCSSDIKNEFYTSSSAQEFVNLGKKLYPYIDKAKKLVLN